MSGFFCRDYDADLATPNDPKSGARRPALAAVVHRDERNRKAIRRPRVALRIPKPGFSNALVGDDYIHVAITIEVQQAYAVILSIGGTEWHAMKKILIHAILRLAKVQKFDFLSVTLHGVINELDDLFWKNPPMGMKNQIHRPLCDDRCVERRLPIGNRGWIICAMEMLRLPIARHDARKFPAELSDDVRVGIVLNRGGKRRERQIFSESRAAIILHNQGARKRSAIGGKDVHHRRVDGE